MKALLLASALAGLSGCAAYPAAPASPAYDGAVAPAPYVVEPPVYAYGGVYPYGLYPYGFGDPFFDPFFFPRGFHHFHHVHPDAFPHHPHPGHEGRGPGMRR